MLENLTALNLILLGVAMFASGFIDAIAGGGGLIQTPAMLLSFRALFINMENRHHIYN